MRGLRLALAFAILPSNIALAQRNTCGIWSSGQTVVASTGDSIRRSTDGGVTWTDIWLGNPTYLPLCAIAGAGAEVVTVGASDQIYRSADTGRTWTMIQDVVNDIDASLHDVWTSRGTFVAVGNRMEILRSTDGGARWLPVPLPTGKELFAVVAIAGNGDTAVAVTTKHILRSTDLGLHWKKVWTPDGFVFEQVWADGATFVAIGSWGTIVRSSDGGATWKVLRKLPRPAPIRRNGTVEYPGASESLNDIWGQGGTWIIVGSDGLILRSTDNGEHWLTVPSGTSNDLSLIALTPFGLFASGADVYGEVRLRSTDSGATWTALP